MTTCQQQINQNMRMAGQFVTVLQLLQTNRDL
jgi:hypothetical protein